MGKIKRRKLQRARYNPMQTTHENGEGVSNDTDQVQINGSSDICEETLSFPLDKLDSAPILSTKGGIRNVREKISSTVVEEKLTGLNILASLALEEKDAETLIKNKMVTSMAPLLQDSNSQVRLAATGALRNLCLGASDEIVDLMVQQNILSPLAHLLKEFLNHEPPPPTEATQPSTVKKVISDEMQEKHESMQIFIHATNLLWNLCECNQESIKVCNKENLAQVLLNHINPFEWTYPVSMAAADCLLCISENNPQVISSMLPQADSLVKLASSSLCNNNSPAGLRFAVILSGILVNLNYYSPDGASFRQVFEVLSRALEITPESLTNQILLKKSNSQEDTEYLITAQMLALEILSNICCPEEEEQWEECDQDMSDEETIIDEDCMNICKMDTSLVCPEVIEGIKYYELVDKTLKKTSFSIKDLPVDEKTKENIEKLRLLEIRSLQCFQNLVGVLDVEDLGGINILIGSWFSFGKILFNDGEADPNLLESISGAMRAILDKVTSENCQAPIDISEADLKQLCESGISCSLAPVRANLSRMVANFGCLLLDTFSPEDPKNSQVLVTITEYLLKVGSSDKELFVQAEALDGIIDLFADDKTDDIASSVQLIERLKAIQPDFKAKHNKCRKKLGDHRPLVVTVRDNLSAFIKYKGPRTQKVAA